MFTKDEIKSRWLNERRAALAAGKDLPRADINLALLILSSALFHQKDWGGNDYAPHPIRVGFNGTRSSIKQMIGILHDVVEDSDWTIEDLKEMDFPKRVWRGVDGLTLRKDEEKYAEFIERCGLSGADAIDKKIEDLEHNSMNTRNPGIFHSEHADLKRDMYNIAYFYLVARKKEDIEPGTRIIDFVRGHDSYRSYPDLVNKVLDRFSGRPDRLESSTLTPAFIATTAPNP